MGCQPLVEDEPSRKRLLFLISAYEHTFHACSQDLAGAVFSLFFFCAARDIYTIYTYAFVTVFGRW